MQLSLNVQGVLRDVQQAFYGLCVNAGKQVLAAMMEADRVALCGAKSDVKRHRDPELEALLHLFLMNRGVLITPFHNMMLCCPGTTAGDVDQHNAAFEDLVAELVG